MRQEDNATELGNYVPFFFCKALITMLYVRPGSVLPEPQNADVYFMTNLLFEIVQTDAGELSDIISTTRSFRNVVENGSVEETNICLLIYNLSRGQLMMLISHMVESHSSLNEAIDYIQSFPDEI